VGESGPVDPDDARLLRAPISMSPRPRSTSMSSCVLLGCGQSTVWSDRLASSPE
jgi:hypothetical protein